MSRRFSPDARGPAPCAAVRLGLCAGLAVSLSLGLWACDDAAPSATADAEVGGGRDLGGRITTDVGLGRDRGPTADAAGPRPDAGADAAGPIPDTGPAPDCVADEDCGGEAVCDRERCVPGQRCAPDFSCPVGRVCVANICIADPRSTGGLVAEPPQLVFTFSNVGEQVVRDVVLRNDGDATLEVARIEIGGSATFAVEDLPELPVRLVPGQVAGFTVRYTADDDVIDEGQALAYGTNAATPPVAVALRSDFKAVGGLDPCLRLEPVRLDFGPVARGHDRTLGFDLVSCGQAPVSVNAIRRGAGLFGVLPDTFDLAMQPAFPIRLAPNQRQRIDVTYSPRRAGFESGFWEVFSNDPGNARQRVDVSALGTPPPLEDVAMHIRLNWTTDETDVDLHLLGPGGQMWTCAGDCYFSNGQPEWGDPAEFRDNPFLDVDDVDGFGPENINLEAPAPGTYRVLVHYWDSHGGRAPDATVEVLEFGQVVASYGPQHLGQVDDVWEVADLEWPARNYSALGRLTHPNRGGLCGGF